MFKFDNILICLDLTDMDESLIGYANYAVETFKPKRITFIHVMDSYEIPDELADLKNSIEKPIEEIVKEELLEKVNAVYTKSDQTKPEVVLVSGTTIETIVKYAHDNKTDLAVMGKKVGYVGQGGVVKNIIGLIPSSVLLISETTRHDITKIMVRTNFAKPSYVAYNMATLLVNYTNASIEFHNVYKLPYNYFPEQSPQAVARLKKQLEPYMTKKYQKFTKKYKLDSSIPFDYSIDTKGDEAQALYYHAIKNGVDLVITGTRLKSQLANVIMDSTSEKLSGVEKNIPVMIVKDIKDSVGFLKALFD